MTRLVRAAAGAAVLFVLSGWTWSLLFGPMVGVYRPPVPKENR